MALNAGANKRPHPRDLSPRPGRLHCLVGDFIAEDLCAAPVDRCRWLLRQMPSCASDLEPREQAFSVAAIDGFEIARRKGAFRRRRRSDGRSVTANAGVRSDPRREGAQPDRAAPRGPHCANLAFFAPPHPNNIAQKILLFLPPAPIGFGSPASAELLSQNPF
jgi:hypothetical protein